VSGYSALGYAVRFTVIAKYLSQLYGVLALLLLIPCLPAAFLFARGWSQWIGGIGVVVLALAVLLRSGHATNNLGFKRPNLKTFT
jgi:Trk-type K+ transport system membrane component